MFWQRREGQGGLAGAAQGRFRSRRRRRYCQAEAAKAALAGAARQQTGRASAAVQGPLPPNFGARRRHHRAFVMPLDPAAGDCRKHTENDKQDHRPPANARASVPRPAHPSHGDQILFHPRRPKMGRTRQRAPPLRLQIDLERPKKKPRRGPNCGAPTPMPDPSRISYSLSKTLITSNRAVRSPASPRSKSWLAPMLSWV